MTETERILNEMLKENTGAHMLDSGGAYGRNHERNQERNFESELASTLECDTYTANDGKRYSEISVTHNVFHWLSERLEYDCSLDAAFQAYCQEREGESPYYLMEPFVEKLGGKGLCMVNTYNGEDLLSQTLQYCYFEINGTAYVLLQIHGGCDVRGGYTDPRVFQVSDECAMFDNARATITCDNYGEGTCQANWSTDDGCNWYYDGSTGHTKLQDYDFTTDPKEKGQGKVYIKDKQGYCPKCGGKLWASN